MSLREDDGFTRAPAGLAEDEVGVTVDAGPSARAEAPRPVTPAAKPAASPSPAPADIAKAAADAAPQPQARSRRKLILIAVGLAALAAALWYGYGWWTHGRFIVSTDDAYVAGDVTILAAKAAGYVEKIEVAPNQRVEANQVIARIDRGDYALAVDAAAGKVATQEAAASRIGRQIEAAQAQVPQFESQIAAARADSVRAAADFTRQTRLSQSDYASQSRLEQARADRDRAVASVAGAEAALVAARANVAVLEAQLLEGQRLAAEYRTAQAKAQRDLSFTVVRAPVAGVVANRAIEIGSYVQPGTRLAALVPLDTVHIDANFKETQLSGLRPGQRVEIEVDAFGGRVVEGTVESIAPASGAQFSLLPPENATGNFTKIVQRVPVRIAVDPVVAREGNLRPGLSVVTRIDIRGHSSGAR